jgi:putative ABC transport system permease protein
VIPVFVAGLIAHFRAGRTLFVLTVLSVALGVASVLSIQILNANALGAFEGGLDAVSGEADLTVLGKIPLMPSRVVPEALEVSGVEAAWPLLRVVAKLEGREGVYLDIVGIDLVAPLRVPWDASPADLGAALGRPGWAAVTPALAREMGWRVGSAFEVSSGSRRARLTVGALVDFRRLTPLSSPRLVVMDIAQAQDALAIPEGIHQVDLTLARGAQRDDVARTLSRRLGASVRVVTPEQRRRQAASLLSAFRLNLTALSLISLFVGGFLVHASTQAALVRRRREFGLLRSLGMTPRQVLWIILGEVAILGLLGTALGLPIGWWAAKANVKAVSATLTNLYLLEGVETLRLPAWIFVLAAAAGLGGALAGALLPALDMSRKDTRALLAGLAIHERMGRASGVLFSAGWAILGAAALAFLAVGREVRSAGFWIAVALIVALPLMTPWVLKRLCGWIRPRGFDLAYGVKTLGVKLGTTSFAVAAVGVAVTMLVGITLMVGSFRKTLEVWIGSTIRTDVYVTSESWRRARETATLDDDLVAVLVRLPGVRAADRLRQTSAWTGSRRISLIGRDAGLPGGEGRFPLVSGGRADAIRRMVEEGAVLIGEPLARKERLRRGDRLRLATPRGEAEFPIAGVYYDYSDENGSAVMDLAAMEKAFGRGRMTNVDLYLDPGTDPHATMDAIRARFRGVPLEILDQRGLREEILAIFDQTFAVTRLLQGMALLIAACGITLTLLVLARERVAELALYRALGAGRLQIFRVFLGEGVGMALLGLVLGAPGGAALAMILIFVINRAYFGWTISPSVPVWALAAQASAMLAAAAIASVYPAVRASRTPASELSRDDL